MVELVRRLLASISRFTVRVSQPNPHRLAHPELPLMTPLLYCTYLDHGTRPALYGLQATPHKSTFTHESV